MTHYNTKRLVKNTIALYIRTFFTLLISLYTSRIVLNTLGVEDFGVYNVVGGVVLLFVFLNSAMANGTQRFMNYEMGLGNTERIKNVFSSSLLIHISIALLILLLSETIGLWFVNNKLVIPASRMYAVNWVYQFSILSTIFTLVQIPYLASIIANEKMMIYGYVGILEAVLKLVVVYLLVIGNVDKLILYSFLLLVVQLLIAFVNIIYCRKKFSECRFVNHNDKNLYKEMISFSSWNLLASIAAVSKGQGQNIMLNIFFGPVVNAARAISMSISGITSQFVGGFMTAVNHQITKSYSSSKNDFQNLVFKSSKFAFFLLSFVSIPILFNTKLILDLWLVNPPELSAVFSQLVLIDALIVCISFPLTTSAQATGNIKIFHISVTFFELLNLPISYLILKMGYPPVSVYFVTIFMSILALAARLIVLRRLINLPIKKYSVEVILRCWFIFGLTYSLLLYVNIQHSMPYVTIIFNTLLSTFVLLTLIITVGINKQERLILYSKTKDLLKKYI